MKTVDYLDAVKRRLNIESDYALAQRLALSKQAIAALRKRDAVMSTTTAAKVSAILELDPLRVIADAELERGSDDQLWKKLRASAAAVLVAIGATLFPLPDAQAAGLNISVPAFSSRPSGARTFYTLHQLWRALARLLGWLR